MAASLKLLVLQVARLGSNAEVICQDNIEYMNLRPHCSAKQVSTGEVKPLGPPRVYIGVNPSPDTQYLLVSWFERPYSFNVPCGRFPRKTALWDRSGPLT